MEFNVKRYKYTVIFEPAEEGGYVVHIPALPGLVTEGDTLKEAKKMAKDAIKCHLLSLLHRNQPIPDDFTKVKPLVDELAIAI